MSEIDKFVKPDNPILSEVSAVIPVAEIQSSETKLAIQLMRQAALGERMDAGHPLLVGLAAPQIGIKKRIIMFDDQAKEKGVIGHQLKIAINPVIIWHSENSLDTYELCFSSPGVAGVVPRWDHIKVRAYDENGTVFEEEYFGYTARIFQHEIDHLNGIEFPDRISAEEVDSVCSEDIQAYRQGYLEWSKKLPMATWEKMKGRKKKDLA